MHTNSHYLITQRRMFSEEEGNIKTGKKGF